MAPRAVPPRRPRSWRGWSHHISVPLLTALSVGCSQNHSPYAPGSAIPQFVRVPTEQLATLSDDSDPHGSALISAQDGGSLQVGRFRLDFAPGALLQDTEISITDVTNSVGYVQCRLEPEGTVFHARVTLRADFSDLATPTQYTMYWHVPTPTSQEVWSDVGGDPTWDGRGILTHLQHFSDYAPGKAGW